MKTIAALFLIHFLSLPAAADICNHTPSKLVGANWTESIAAGAGATAGAGIGMKAMGFYAISHAVTGTTMLASTAAGASAAGTIGIIGGTAGAIGTIGAALMSPLVIVPAALIAGGVGIYEGTCHLKENR